MGIAFRILRWLWRRISDASTLQSILDALDYKTWLPGIIGFAAMMLFGATNYDWSPQAVILAALAAGAFISIIALAIRVLFFAAKGSSVVLEQQGDDYPAAQRAFPAIERESLSKIVHELLDFLEGQAAYLENEAQQIVLTRSNKNPMRNMRPIISPFNVPELRGLAHNLREETIGPFAEAFYDLIKKHNRFETHVTDCLGGARAPIAPIHNACVKLEGILNDVEGLSEDRVDRLVEPAFREFAVATNEFGRWRTESIARTSSLRGRLQ